MVRRHHPVLAPLSRSYSEPKGRFPRVTHPCATNPEGFVRLACVRHAASVRSEPGSNSQVCVTTNQARVRRHANLQGRASRSRYLHIKRNGYEGHVISAWAWSPRGMWHRHKITGIRSLKLPGPGAVAHMSLHQKLTMSKSRPAQEADKNGSPINGPGDNLPELCWRPRGQHRWKPAAPRQ